MTGTAAQRPGVRLQEPRDGRLRKPMSRQRQSRQLLVCGKERQMVSRGVIWRSLGQSWVSASTITDGTEKLLN